MTSFQGWIDHAAVGARRAKALDEAAYSQIVLDSLDDIPALLAEVGCLKDLYSALQAAQEVLSTTVAHIGGSYDWNADPFSLKLKHSEAFIAIDAALAKAVPPPPPLDEPNFERADSILAPLQSTETLKCGHPASYRIFGQARNSCALCGKDA